MGYTLSVAEMVRFRIVTVLQELITHWEGSQLIQLRIQMAGQPSH